jgi:hypothetical protein
MFYCFDPKKIPFSLFDLATFRVDSEKHADTSDASTVARRIYQPLAVITGISDFFPEYFLVDIMKDGVEIFHFSKSGDKWPIITRLVDF